MTNNEIPEELLLLVPSALAADERAAWLAACRLVLAERQAATAAAALVQRYAEESGTAPADVAEELYRRRTVEAAGLSGDHLSRNAAWGDAWDLARARVEVASRVRDALAVAEWELDPTPIPPDLEDTTANRSEE